MTNLENILAAPPHDLATWLIALLDIKRAEVARETGNNPANLSQWLHGREKLLSVARQERVLEWLGLASGKLDSTRIHRWTIKNDFSALRGVLLATETSQTLSKLRFHELLRHSSYKVPGPVLLTFMRVGVSVLIMVNRPPSLGKNTLPLNADTIGFGKNGSVVTIPQEYSDQIPDDVLIKVKRQRRTTTRASSENASRQPLDQLVVELERTNAALRQDVVNLRRDTEVLQRTMDEMRNVISKFSPKHPLLF